MKEEEEVDFAKIKPPKHARDYQISQVTEVPRASTRLNLINLHQRIQKRKN